MNVEETEVEKESLEEEEGEEEIERAIEEAEEIEEEKPAPEEKEEEEIVEERIYTVPLGRAWIPPRKRRSPKAIRILRSFVERHMKVGGDSIRITNEVNEKVWGRGIQKPPRKVRIRASRDAEGIVTVRLAEGS